MPLTAEGHVKHLTTEPCGSALLCPAVLGPVSSFLPLAPGPQLDMGRLLGTWCDPDNTQLLSPPTRPHHLSPFSAFPPCLPLHPPTSSAVSSTLENSFTSLSNYPVQWPSCRSDRTHVTTRPGG
ncbi:unnamed protein product [Pleuronectes platessa]|uniref:Uncharacterized protein n=1 Tax=Pleuronectes platessa TaxID=8262 RepID=A0A9N7VB09_PLEPL|nr:unnamed protein product [Pleuronectes platessa]